LEVKIASDSSSSKDLRSIAANQTLVLLTYDPFEIKNHIKASVKAKDWLRHLPK
jgi:hypothetical protein